MDLLHVLALALMPAFGNIGGGLLAEWLPTPARALSLALHAAAGIVIAVIAVELMPAALAGASVWVVAAGLLAGAVAYLLLELAVDGLRHASGNGSMGTETWMVYSAVAVDLFSDGLMIGVGSTVSLGLAFVLALGQVTADVPEGFATIANLKDKGLPRGRRLVLLAFFAVPPLAGAAIGYLLLRDRSAVLQMAALAFTAGLLLIAAVEDMLEEAHEAQADRRTTPLAFAGGFALFMVIASLFES